MQAEFSGHGVATAAVGSRSLRRLTPAEPPYASGDAKDLLAAPATAASRGSPDLVPALAKGAELNSAVTTIDLRCLCGSSRAHRKRPRRPRAS